MASNSPRSFTFEEYMRMKKEIAALETEDESCVKGTEASPDKKTVPISMNKRTVLRGRRDSTCSDKDLLDQLEATGDALLEKLQKFGVRSQCESIVRLSLSDIRSAYQRVKCEWKSRLKNAESRRQQMEAKYKKELDLKIAKALENDEEHKKDIEKLRLRMANQATTHESLTRKAKAKAKQRRLDELKALEEKLESQYEARIKQASEEYEKNLQEQLKNKVEISKTVESQVQQLEEKAAAIINEKNQELEHSRIQKQELEKDLSTLEQTYKTQSVELAEIRDQLAMAQKQLEQQGGVLVSVTRHLEKEGGAKLELEKLVEKMKSDQKVAAKRTEMKAEEFQELKNQYDFDKKKLKARHRKEIDAIHQKIKKVIFSKDSQIQDYKASAEALQLKVVKLEQYLLIQKDNFSS